MNFGEIAISALPNGEECAIYKRTNYKAVKCGDGRKSEEFCSYSILTKKQTTNDANLVSSSTPISPISDATGLNSNPQDSPVNQDFLTILLNVKNVKLDDSIFSDPAFNSLRDSSIVLVPDNTEGRPNPFAPIGFEKIAAPVNAPGTQINIGTPKN